MAVIYLCTYGMSFQGKASCIQLCILLAIMMFAIQEYFTLDRKNYLFFTSYIINWQTSYIWVFFSTRYGWLSLHSCCVIACGWTQDGWQNRWGLFSSFYPLHYSLRHSYGCLTFRRFFIPSHISMRKCGTSHIIMWILIATYCGDCILLQNLRMILFGIEKGIYNRFFGICQGLVPKPLLVGRGEWKGSICTAWTCENEGHFTLLQADERTLAWSVTERAFHDSNAIDSDFELSTWFGI